MVISDDMVGPLGCRHHEPTAALSSWMSISTPACAADQPAFGVHHLHQAMALSDVPGHRGIGLAT
jgi:hypothetical protein